MVHMATAMGKKFRIVASGFRVGGRSRGRYVTPADFPRHAPGKRCRLMEARTRSAASGCRGATGPGLTTLSDARRFPSFYTVVPRAGGYTHAVESWDSSIIQGPVAPC
jgi:hypothetical protein